MNMQKKKKKKKKLGSKKHLNDVLLDHSALRAVNIAVQLI
jgi:hypothetical protein